MNVDQIIEILLAPAFATINLAYIALLIGAFCQSLHRIRVLLVLAAVFFVAYGAIQGIQSMVVWNLVIGALNLHRLLVGLWEDARVRITAEQEMLRRRLFPEVSPADFIRLWELGDDVLCSDGSLGNAGLDPDQLHLILRGLVQVERGGRVLDVLGSGSVLGELDASRCSAPSTDWRAVGPVWLRSWRSIDLIEPSPFRRALRSLGPGRAVAMAAAA